MAHAVTAVQGLTAVDQTVKSQSAKPQPQTSTAIPKDTVTLSQTAKPAPAAAAATPPKASGDVDHDGDNH